MFFNNPIANFAQPRVTGNNYYYNIVTDGLICYLDATNPASNSGGSTWYDLTPNGYNFTLYNGAAFGGSGAYYGGYGAKYVYFDGTNDYAQINNSYLSSIITFPEYTIQNIISWVTNSEEDTLATGGIGSAGTYLYMAYNGNVRGHNWADGGTTVTDTGGANLYPLWTSGFQQVKYSTSTFRCGTYSLNTTTTLLGTRPTSSPTTYTVIANREANGASGAFGNFYLTAVLYYNRFLSNDEIQQNANTYGVV